MIATCITELKIFSKLWSLFKNKKLIVKQSQFISKFKLKLKSHYRVVGIEGVERSLCMGKTLELQRKTSADDYCNFYQKYSSIPQYP